MWRSFVYLGLLMIGFAFSSCHTEEKKAEEKAGNQLSPDTSAVDKTVSELNRKIAADSLNPFLHHQRAKLFLSQKKYLDALNDMRTTLDIDSTRPEFFLTLADLYLAVGKSGNSKAALEKCLSIDAKNVEANLKLGELYLFVNNHPKSIEYIDYALKSDPHNARAYFMKGMNFKEAGDTAKAVSSFRTAIDQNADYYDAYIQLGILFSLKKNKIAIQYFNSALALRPQSVEALYGQAMYFQETADFNKAIEGYTNILRIDHCNKNAHFNLGFIHQEYLKVYDQAIRHYTDAINCDPNYFAAFYNRGLCYESVGNIASAKADYSTALELNPKYALASDGLKRMSK